jgi:hypothetical protein
MATNFQAASGSDLPSPFAPRVFTAAGYIAFVSARLFDAKRPSRKRAEEIVYRDGAFHWPYDAGSTRVGSLFTVVREGGWPIDLELHVEPAGGATLQPLNYAANIVAAWALNEPAGDANLDRSGRGRHFTSSRLASEMANAPDLVPGKSCIWSPGPYASAPKTCRQTDAVWGMYGEYTLAYRMFLSTPEGSIEHCFVQGQGTPAGVASVAFQSGVIGNGATPYCLYYYAERLKVGQVFFSTLSVTPNRWAWITQRRRADGSVRLGLGTGPSDEEQTYQDSGALLLPATASADPRYINIGGWQDDTTTMGGGMADLVIWDRFLSDDELKPQYAAAMRGAHE